MERFVRICLKWILHLCRKNTSTIKTLFATVGIYLTLAAGIVMGSSAFFNKPNA